MRRQMVYYGALDLKSLRRKYGWTAEQLADLIHCSTRTVNRIEAGNRTGNLDIARRCAELFGYPFERLFVSADQHFLDRLASAAPLVSLGPPLEKTVYYLLYFRRISWWDADLWGKTKWVGPYDGNHEIRVLHELGEGAAQRFWAAGIPAVSTQAEWEAFLYRSVIGRMQRVLASEACLKTCAPRALAYYVVASQTLLAAGQSDVILLGDYSGAPGVRALSSIERAGI